MKKLLVNMISESEFTVQAHGVHTAYVEITDALKKRSDLDVEVNANSPADIVHIQTVGFYSLRKLLSRHGKKVVSAHVVPDSFVGSLRAARWWKPLGAMWLRFFYGRADVVLACSKMVQDELRDHMHLKNVDLLYNSIDMSRYVPSPDAKKEARAHLGIAPDAFVVIGNGQVQPRKRLDTFVAMANAMPDVEFIWVGGIPFGWLGADFAAMNHLVDHHPANMRFTGVIPLADVKQYYHAADVFVLPAEQENHPMCVLEASGAGLPIVLRDIPEYNDTFKSDAYMATSDQTFIDTVKRLRDDAQYRDEAVAGAHKIAERFDSAASAARLDALYHELAYKARE